ncbi:glutathione S-transferase N-terminal domain-containing protein [Stenotrophomonas sp. 169]|uniref:glutathione S-transferase N-terminal domain-containing protein n=1 Tax=unclassified Stenotrophomonas TaxID=196198 RepID=UPI0016626FBE|nr:MULTISPECIES: glutathione binding-like protein [unclassified Stenotrophomonas]MBD8696107.1 glutathione S-transferase N-terminal domain-containing protein [Stenotrophomonas sp. CFBP 13718]QNR97175.1 glutathione S-transferase N-terminal domain-containing protein [Stenotrophomonas sp. 169]
MIDLYYWPTPNGHKVTLFLEEAGLEYRIHPVNIGAGDQFKPEFLAISPNNKMPAIVDNAPAGGGAPLSVFESGAILLYLAEKTGTFLSRDARERVETLEWLFWQMAGLGPMSGQMGHFTVYAPEKIPYAIERYGNEVTRLHGVMDKRLAQHEWLAGSEYSIADMASYPWIGPYDKLPPDYAAFPNLHRWQQAIAARPATQRAYALRQQVNPDAGKPMGEEERKHLFGKR